MKRCILGVLLVSFGLASTGRPQETDGSSFLRVRGIFGDSEDPDHREWTNVTSFQFSAATEGSAGEDPVFSNLTVFAEPDSATRDLMDLLLNGTTIATVELERTELFQNRESEVVEEWNLRNAVVSTFSRDGADTIQYGFAYEEAEFCFSDRRDDGSLWVRTCTDFGSSRPQEEPTIPDLVEEGIVVATPQGDTYLRVSGIDGRSEDPNHEGWIDVDTFGISVLRLPENDESSKELAASDLAVVAPFDATTRALFEMLVLGETIPDVELELVESSADSDHLDVEQWNLQDAHVVRVVREDNAPMELAFAYEQAEYCQIERNHDGFNVSRECAKVERPAASPPLQAGDANQDLIFDQLDLVRVQQAGTYLSDKPATWGSGDWDGAPGGSVGSPPPGDGKFDQLDVVAALNASLYLKGLYAATGPDEPAEVQLEHVSVPEPPTFVLAMLAFVLLRWRRRSAAST